MAGFIKGVFGIDPLLLGSVIAGSIFLLPVAAKVEKKLATLDKNEVYTRTGLKILGEEDKNIIQLKIIKAGEKITPEEFQGKKVVYTSCYLLIITILSIVFKLHAIIMFFLYVFALLVWLFPSFQLNSKITRRQAELRNKLSEFTNYLSTTVASVSDPVMALNEAAKATGGVYEEEIGRVIIENASGKSLTDALFDLTQRVDVDEINSLVSTLHQIFIVGVPAAEKMKEYSEKVRMIKRFEVMDQAGKLSVKLIFIVLIFMLIPVLMVIGYPAMYAIMTSL